jgi:hypothetical protein
MQERRGTQTPRSGEIVLWVPNYMAVAKMMA